MAVVPPMPPSRPGRRPQPQRPANEPAPGEAPTEGGEEFSWFGKRMWVAAWISLTYILAFGRTKDGTPYIESVLNRANSLVDLPASGSARMPQTVTVRAKRRGKLVSSGRAGRVKRVEAAGGSSGGRDTGSSVGLHAGRKAAVSQAAQRQGLKQVGRDPQTGQFVRQGAKQERISEET